MITNIGKRYFHGKHVHPLKFLLTVKTKTWFQQVLSKFIQQCHKRIYNDNSSSDAFSSNSNIYKVATQPTGFRITFLLFFFF